MRARPPHPLRARAVRWLAAWCLLAALPLQGLSAAVAGLLGPLHFHHRAAEAAVDAGSLAGWQDFRRVDHFGGARAAEAHAHDGLGRHAHAQGDDSVAAVGADGQGDDAGDGAVPSFASPFVGVVADGASTADAAPPCAAADWSPPRAEAFRSCDLRRLERPPRG